ncbi:hypothetical protein PR202_ga16168 [Eleusine coracana subsp. coracana]|uniref:UBC core domain-containing protein n=1 Tax=Eleusine coracana subsp. coracana TaxID=191504 RepID=A0AAV5CM17_ELECO|nr:hypothetical protein PR202_ga16168 [Eleusine coracana subsp. coracana]
MADNNLPRCLIKVRSPSSRISTSFNFIFANLVICVLQETQRLLSEPAPGINASPLEENMRYFNVMILGPSQSPYEGEEESFRLILMFCI